MAYKINRVIYRLWHDKSVRGRVGYIGKDSHYPRRVNLKQRKKYDAKCRKLHAALNKYPLFVWNVEILASSLRSEKLLNKAEIFYIKKFDSKNKGYNLTDGGEGTCGWVPPVWYRKNQSRKMTGRKASVKTKRKMSRRRRGKKNPFYGKSHTTETKKKLSKALKGKTSYWKGKKMPLQLRIKLSLAHMGKKQSKETIQKKRKMMLQRYSYKFPNPRRIISFYLKGYTLRQTGREFGLPHKTIKNFLMRKGVTIRVGWKNT